MANSQTQTDEQRLAQIEEDLASGISSTTTDGTSVSVDLAALEREANRLRSQIANRSRRRPKTGTLRIW